MQSPGQELLEGSSSLAPCPAQGPDQGLAPGSILRLPTGNEGGATPRHRLSMAFLPEDRETTSEKSS